MLLWKVEEAPRRIGKVKEGWRRGRCWRCWGHEDDGDVPEVLDLSELLRLIKERRP